MAEGGLVDSYSQRRSRQRLNADPRPNMKHFDGLQAASTDIVASDLPHQSTSFQGISDAQRSPKKGNVKRPYVEDLTDEDECKSNALPNKRACPDITANKAPSTGGINAGIQSAKDLQEAGFQASVRLTSEELHPECDEEVKELVDKGWTYIPREKGYVYPFLPIGAIH